MLSTTATFSAGVLTITADNTGPHILVGYTNSSGTDIDVYINGTPTSFAQTGEGAQVVTALHVLDGSGADQVSIINDILGPAAKTWNIPTTVKGGNGGDFFQSQGNETDLVYGGSGNDTISVGNGNDSIFSGAGTDSITVGSGNDLIFGNGPHTGSPGDTITCGGGDDTIFALGGNDAIHTGNGAFVLMYGSNGDSIFGGTGTDKMFVLDPATVTISAGSDVIVKHVAHHRDDTALLKTLHHAIHDVVVAANLGIGF